MIFKIQDLTFNFFGLLALEGYAAFAARCVVALLLAGVGEVARRWLRGWVFPQLRRIPWPSRAIGILLDSFASPASWLALTTGLYLAVASLPLPGAVGAAEGGFLRAMAIFFGLGLVTPAVLVSRGISFYTFLLISGGVTLLVHLRRRSAATPPQAGQNREPRGNTGQAAA